MKKFISLILVLVMVFSVTVFASAAGFQDVEDSKNEIAIEELYDLGVLEGYGNGKFGPRKELTRAEAATIIVRAMIDEEDIYATPGMVFSDVGADKWYEEYVETAYRNDLIHGYGDGMFGPADKVTYAQCATMVLNMLGYDATRLAGTWPENVVNRADNMDLYYKVSAHKNSDAILREDVAQMIYNALDCEMVVWSHGKFEPIGITLREYLTSDADIPESNIDYIVLEGTIHGLHTLDENTVGFILWSELTDYHMECNIQRFDARIKNQDTAQVVYDIVNEKVISVVRTEEYIEDIDPDMNVITVYVQEDIDKDSTPDEVGHKIWYHLDEDCVQDKKGEFTHELTFASIEDIPSSWSLCNKCKENHLNYFEK